MRVRRVVVRLILVCTDSETCVAEGPEEVVLNVKSDIIVRKGLSLRGLTEVDPAELIAEASREDRWSSVVAWHVIQDASAIGLRK